MVRQYASFLDMVLGLYYITKGKKINCKQKSKGEGKAFYSADEVIIALNEKQVDFIR